jgi:hypothetical protein
MIFNHHRFQIWNQNQHPFVHTMSDFGYANPNLPGITNMQGALDYLVAVIYPNAKPAVQTYADLPLVGNVIGDYRVVNDGGDGRSEGWRWEQREGEAAPSWHKIYDVDWSMDSILASWQGQTLGFYVQKIGHDDADETGTPITGIYAGQRIFGGASSNTNLTLSANSGDGAGPQTGFVQVTDSFRPTLDNSLSLGTTDERWSSVWSYDLVAGTMALSGGSITDSSGAIDFGLSNLSTTGSVTTGTMVLSSGSISDSSGEVDFGSSDIRTTGDVYADSVVLSGTLNLPSGSQVADFTFTNGNINCATPTVNLNALNLTTTGSVTAGLFDVDNLRLDGNTLSVTALNQDLTLSANGTGSIILGSKLSTSSQISVTDSPVLISGATSYLEVGSVKIQGITISTPSPNPITLQPGNSVVSVVGSLVPTPTSARDLGLSGLRWRNLFINQSIQDGTNSFPIPDLMKLKDSSYRTSDRSQSAQVGDSLFWDGTQWLASAPDTEIVHSSLSGLALGDAGHTQFALLDGRAGGQSLIGGTGSGEGLTLSSTSHAVKGFIIVSDTVSPLNDSSYSGSWSGLDIGRSTYRFNDVYTAGEFKGLRVENVGTLPSSSSQKVGRLLYYTADQNLYIDTGATVKQVGGSRVYYETVWDGTQSVKDITVSGVDARFAIWQLKDNTNDFDVIYCSIKATSSTNVRIDLGSPLPAGTYRLVGV